MRSLFDEFKTFLLRGNAVELAVGIVIGVAFNGIVNSLVADMFMPVVGLITDDSLGGVIGVTVEHNGTRRDIKAARGVVLATGGFEWDAELLKSHFPGDVEFLSSPSTNTTDPPMSNTLRTIRRPHVKRLDRC